MPEPLPDWIVLALFDYFSGGSYFGGESAAVEREAQVREFRDWINQQRVSNGHCVPMEEAESLMLKEYRCQEQEKERHA